LRLDKLLANTGYGSRKDVKLLLRKKHVTVNGKYVVNSSSHVSPDSDIIEVDGKGVHYKKYIYLMLNKPKGYISATEDAREKTVIDLLSEDVKPFSPFPVGRLDKDTEGLLLLTNDGELNHHLTSPKKEVPKTYEAFVKGKVTDAHVDIFQGGVILDDGYKTKPASLQIISSNDQSIVCLIITEGKYHQVKRMFKAIGMEVVYLKRLKMGSLWLDETLQKGEFRELTEREIAQLTSTGI